MGTNDNITKNGWSEYGRLVLNELQRLNDGQESLRKDFEEKFEKLNQSMTEFKSTEKDVTEIKEWKEKVTEVWSPTQMKEVKNQVYAQKGFLQKALGIVIAIEFIIYLILQFGDKIFK